MFKFLKTTKYESLKIRELEHYLKIQKVKIKN